MNELLWWVWNSGIILGHLAANASTMVGAGRRGESRTPFQHGSNMVLVVRPGARSSIFAPSSEARSPYCERFASLASKLDSA